MKSFIKDGENEEKERMLCPQKKEENGLNNVISNIDRKKTLS